jgi:hypothetical protein
VVVGRLVDRTKRDGGESNGARESDSPRPDKRSGKSIFSFEVAFFSSLVPFFDERKKVCAALALLCACVYVAGRGHRASAFSLVPVDRARASGRAAAHGKEAQETVTGVGHELDHW